MFESVDFLHLDFRGIWRIISNGNSGAPPARAWAEPHS